MTTEKIEFDIKAWKNYSNKRSKRKWFLKSFND